MDIPLSLEEEWEEDLLNEVIAQYAYFLGREPNEKEVEKLYKTLFLQGVRNRFEIWNAAIFAMGGLNEYHDCSWKNYSMEEVEKEEFEDIPTITSC